jgi:CheY-like chemotaxis protein
MEPQRLQILLVRKSQNGSSVLATRLAAQGWTCTFANSLQNVGMLLDQRTFDLVLAPIRLESDSLYPLIDRLEGTETTLFYSLGVEDGSWWLPALRRGENCFGEPAIHSSAFMGALEKTIQEIRQGALTAAQSSRHPRLLLADALPDSTAHSTSSDPVSPDLITILPASRTSSSARPFAEDSAAPAPPQSAKIVTISARRSAR